MMDFLQKNKVAIIAAVIVLGGLVWWGTGGSTDSGATLTPAAVGAPVAQERAVLDALLQLRSIELRGDVFNDPAFLSLRDFRTEILAEPVGRRNPFAPLGARAEEASIIPANQ